MLHVAVVQVFDRYNDNNIEFRTFKSTVLSVYCQRVLDTRGKENNHVGNQVSTRRMRIVFPHLHNEHLISILAALSLVRKTFEHAIQYRFGRV